MYLKQNFLNKLFRLGTLVVILLVILDLYFFFFNPGNTLAGIFRATREQTPLTWISAVIFLFIGLSAATLYLENQRKRWKYTSLIFLFFSMDDAAYLHERLTGVISKNVPFFQEFPTYIWFIFYLPAGLFAILGLTYYLWKKNATLHTRKMLLFVLGAISVAVLLDLLEGFVNKDSSLVFCLRQNCHIIVIHLLRLTEEVLEVLAFGILSYISFFTINLVDRNSLLCDCMIGLSYEKNKNPN